MSVFVSVSVSLFLSLSPGGALDFHLDGGGGAAGGV